jgi:pyruvate, water dikinase
MRSAFAIVTLALSAFLGCGDLDPADGSGGAGGVAGSAGAGGGGAAPVEPIEFLSVLESAEHYAALSGEGAEVKYLTIVDGTEPPAAFQGAACLFQNTALYPYHVQFLRTLPGYGDLSSERYTDLVLRRTSRVMWGGGLKLLPGAPHPQTGTLGVLAYTVYAGSEPSEALTLDDLVEVDRRLKQDVPFAAELLSFMPEGVAQQVSLEPLLDELAEADVLVLDPSLARPGLGAETYSEGEGYGFLKLAADGELGSVGPRDVLVIDAAPNELGLVAGLVTARPQSVASHLNLRLREKSIPSAAVSTIWENPVILGLSERLVHLRARGHEVVIEPARLEDAEAFWSSRQPPLGTPRADLERSELVALDELDASAAPAFGTKAANLGELSRILPDENRVHGFAIPFRAYAEFMQESGLAAEVAALLADPRVGSDAAHKRDARSDSRG